MKIITYTVKQTIAGFIKKNYKEITNVEKVMFIGVEQNKILIDYKYKDKKYNLFDREELKTPMSYHLEIIEE